MLEEIVDWVVYLEYLQAIFKKYNFIAASNDDILICYFQKKIHLFIQAQLNNLGQNLDICDKIVQKIVNVEIKTNL